MSDQKTISLPAKNIPLKDYDVVIIGGGTAGAIAAIAAARQGARTLLVESKGYLGGTVVEGGTALHSFFNNWKSFDREKIQLVRGIPSELVDRLIEQGGCTGHAEMESNYEYDSVCTAVDVEIYKTVVHEMVKESGADIMMNTRLADVLSDGGTIHAAILSSHQGLLAVHAHTFIDATGYGDLSAWAGAEFTEPNDKRISAPIGVANVDMDRYAQYCRELGARTDFCRGIRDGKPDGIVRVDGAMSRFPEEFQRLNRDIGAVLTITSTHKSYFMFVKIEYKLDVSPTDTAAMSAAELELRRRQEKAVELLRRFIPGCENAFIARSTPGACIRRGRCIVCDYDISNEDITSGRHFEDDVFEYGFHDEAPLYNVAEGGSYGFPYRAMLPKGIKNLYAVGMLITSEHHAHMSTRNTVSCMAQGQAVGTAAAMCAASGLTTRELPYPELRKQLVKAGVYLT